MWVGSDSAMMPAALLCREPILSAVHVSMLVTCCAAAIAAGLKGGEFDGVGFPCHFHNV